MSSNSSEIKKYIEISSTDNIDGLDQRDYTHVQSSYNNDNIDYNINDIELKIRSSYNIDSLDENDKYSSSSVNTTTNSSLKTKTIIENEDVPPCPTILCLSAEKASHLFTWACLLFSTICLASIGPTFKWLLVDEHVASGRAAFWRNLCSLFFLIPPAIIEYRQLSQDEKDELWHGASQIKNTGEGEVVLPCTNYQTLWYCFIIGICWSSSLIIWVESLKITTIVRCSLFFSVYQLFLVLYLKFVGVPVSTGEFAGVAISLFGMIVSLLDSISFDGFDSAIVGDLLCVVAAFFYTCNILCATTVRKYVPLFIYTATLTIFVCCTTSFYSLAFEGSDFSLSRNGIFGCFGHDMALIMFIFAFVFGVFGILGVNYCMKNIHPLIFGAVQLLDTPLTGIIAWIGGMESLPKVWTFVGGFIIIIGIGLVCYYEHKRKEEGLTNFANLNNSEDYLPGLEMSNMNPVFTIDDEDSL